MKKFNYSLWFDMSKNPWEFKTINANEFTWNQNLEIAIMQELCFNQTLLPIEFQNFINQTNGERKH